MLRLGLVMLAAGCATTAGRQPVDKLLADGLPLAPDAFSWGTGPRDVFIGPAGAGIPVAADAERRVFVAPDGRSAWFWETSMRSGRKLRRTGLAGEMGGKWTILVQHASFGWGSEVDKKDEEGALPELAPVGEGVAPGAEEIAALAREVAFFDRMICAATPPDFLLMGTDPGYLEGSVVKPLPPEHQNGPRPRDGVRAGLGPGGLTGWAAANMVWMQKGNRTMGPMRFLYIFVRDGGRWRLVQNHHSFAPE